MLAGSAKIDPDWRDIDAIVSKWQWVTEAELKQVPHNPDTLGAVAFGIDPTAIYDPLEPIVR